MNISIIKYPVLLLMIACAVSAQGEVVSSSVETNTRVSEPVPLGADGKPLMSIYEKLSLDDCINLALANSPSAVAAQLTMQNAHVNLNLAKSQFLPTASAGFDSRYNMGASVHDYGASNVVASANLTLSGLTDMARNVRMQQISVEQAELNFQSVKNDIVRNVRKKYYALLAAQRTVDIRTQSREVYEDQYKRTSEYYRLGLRPKVDVTTAEVNLNNESLRLIKAKNAVKTASASLANTLGVTTSTILQVEEDVSFDQPNLTLEEAVKNGIKNARTENNDDHINLIFGDPGRAKVIFTAHYDTPRRMLFPNLMLVTNRMLEIVNAYLTFSIFPER